MQSNQAVEKAADTTTEMSTEFLRGTIAQMRQIAKDLRAEVTSDKVNRKTLLACSDALSTNADRFNAIWNNATRLKGGDSL